MSMTYPSFSLATCEPYFSFVHGESAVHGESSVHGELSVHGQCNKWIVIYEYTLDEFYQNEWKEDLSFYKKKILNKVKYQQHPMIRNYKNILKKSKLELVEMIEVNNVCYSILHTYKINILKRLWKKYKNQMN